MNITNIINSNFNYIGVRWTCDDEQYDIGDCCRNSYDWDYDADCSSYDTDSPMELDGTCAVNTNVDLSWDDPDELEKKITLAVKKHNYVGTIIIIGGDRATCGADEDEIIIENAVVIDKIDKEV